MSRVSMTFTEAPIADVLLAFARFSGNSIVQGVGVAGFVTAEIIDTPWDVALGTILAGHGLVAVENEYGVIRVSNMEDLNAGEVVAPIVTRVYRISFSRAAELQPAIAAMLSPRGSVSVAESTNSLIVSDIERVHGAVARLIGADPAGG